MLREHSLLLVYPPPPPLPLVSVLWRRIRRLHFRALKLPNAISSSQYRNGGFCVATYVSLFVPVHRWFDDHRCFRWTLDDNELSWPLSLLWQPEYLTHAWLHLFRQVHSYRDERMNLGIIVIRVFSSFLTTITTFIINCDVLSVRHEINSKEWMKHVTTSHGHRARVRISIHRGVS